MAYLVVFRRERRSEQEVWKDYFIVDSSVVKKNQKPQVAIEAAFRLAVEEDLWTQKRTYYNWGDAMEEVPDEVFEKHGISLREADKTYSISGEIFEITVDQDEVLSRDYHSWPDEVLDEILAKSHYSSLDSLRAAIWRGDVELYDTLERYIVHGYNTKNVEEYTVTSTGHVVHYFG